MNTVKSELFIGEAAQGKPPRKLDKVRKTLLRITRNSDVETAENIVDNRIHRILQLKGSKVAMRRNHLIESKNGNGDCNASVSTSTSVQSKKDDASDCIHTPTQVPNVHTSEIKLNDDERAAIFVTDFFDDKRMQALTHEAVNALFFQYLNTYQKKQREILTKVLNP